jgi:hypothetical protein
MQGLAPQLLPCAFQRGLSPQGGIGKCKEIITALRTRGLVPGRYRAIQRSEEGEMALWAELRGARTTDYRARQRFRLVPRGNAQCRSTRGFQRPRALFHKSDR